jgi:ABC-type transport system involved in multi-copper enzyme maturation permease subunit
MSTVLPSDVFDATEAPPAAEPSRWGRAWRQIEDRLVALVNRANPILVKETRQALKSRQFVITFLVVLVACWIVSFVGVAWVGPEIYWAAAGPTLLTGYFVVLTVPLALIVPFAAFRSLAAEQEEQTYELLSITTLSSRKIITGKLASAAVQMLVYLCAVSPCIAFTFLLRGVDGVMIGILLAGAVIGSMGLSMIALLIGAMSRVRGTQVVTSVIVILGLALACIGGIALGWAVIQEGSAFVREEGFWIAMAGLMTFYVTTFGLFHSAAAAQIAFASENRSTPLRRWMMLQQACFCGWAGGGIYAAVQYASSRGGNPTGEIVMVAATFAGGYWYLMGALLTGEWPHLSRRVQRSLPQSTLGRTTLSLFNPGPGTGYLFAVANLTTLVVAGLILLAFRGPAARSFTPTERILYYLILGWSYVVGYLGFGRLLIVFLRRWIYVPMTAAFLLQIILLMAGTFAPMVIQMTSRELRRSGYTLLQASNPFWTLHDLIDHGESSVQAELLIWIVPAMAFAGLLLNMRSVATELMHHRVAPPVRVVEEEAALNVPEVKPSNPWEIEEDEQ